VGVQTVVRRVFLFVVAVLQAAKAAKKYLDYTAFSHGELIDQLEHDGFTSAQAAYGVTAVGL
jgi:Host cell surface-exposed lipoprotein